eukprot:Platyproteum_vivax@DN6812_c0_g1_i2.p1
MQGPHLCQCETGCTCPVYLHKPMIPPNGFANAPPMAFTLPPQTVDDDIQIVEPDLHTESSKFSERVAKRRKLKRESEVAPVPVGPSSPATDSAIAWSDVNNCVVVSRWSHPLNEWVKEWQGAPLDTPVCHLDVVPASTVSGSKCEIDRWLVAAVSSDRLSVFAVSNSNKNRS